MRKSLFFFLALKVDTMNKVRILFKSRRLVTTPAVNLIFHHEKVNVYKTYFNKCNEHFVLCNSSDDLDTLFSSSCISELEAVECKPFCLLISKRNDQSYCCDVINR